MRLGAHIPSVPLQAQSRGGQCVPVVCDSSQESEVRNLFEQVDREQQGRLDVLVNNAYAGVQVLFELHPQLHIGPPPLTSESLSPLVVPSIIQPLLASRAYYSSLFLYLPADPEQL